MFSIDLIGCLFLFSKPAAQTVRLSDSHQPIWLFAGESLLTPWVHMCNHCIVCTVQIFADISFEHDSCCTHGDTQRPRAGMSKDWSAGPPALSFHLWHKKHPRENSVCSGFREFVLSKIPHVAQQVALGSFIHCLI